MPVQSRLDLIDQGSTDQDINLFQISIRSDITLDIESKIFFYIKIFFQATSLSRSRNNSSVFQSLWILLNNEEFPNRGIWYEISHEWDANCGVREPLTWKKRTQVLLDIIHRRRLWSFILDIINTIHVWYIEYSSLSWYRRCRLILRSYHLSYDSINQNSRKRLNVSFDRSLCCISISSTTTPSSCSISSSSSSYREINTRKPSEKPRRVTCLKLESRRRYFQILQISHQSDNWRRYRTSNCRRDELNLFSEIFPKLFATFIRKGIQDINDEERYVYNTALEKKKGIVLGLEDLTTR